MSTRPAECFGTVAVIVFTFETLTLLPATPPMLTFAPERKLVPVRVMTVPPEIGPEAGWTEERAGGGLPWAGGGLPGPVWVARYPIPRASTTRAAATARQ